MRFLFSASVTEKQKSYRQSIGSFCFSYYVLICRKFVSLPLFLDFLRASEYVSICAQSSNRIILPVVNII